MASLARPPSRAVPDGPAARRRPSSRPNARNARSAGSGCSSPACRRSRRWRPAILRSSRARRSPSWRQRPAQVEELAVALARARVPAVLLVEGETGGDVLDALGAAVTAAGLTALHLGRAGSRGPRAERDRVPRQSPSRARPPCGGPRGAARAVRPARPRPGRAGRHDRVVPGAGGRHRGAARRPDRRPRPRRRPVRGCGGGPLPGPTVRRGRAAGRDPGAGRRAGRAAVGSCCSATRRPTSWNGSPRTASWPCSPWSCRATRPSARPATRLGAASRCRPTARRGSSCSPARAPADGPDDIAAREETRGECGC